MRICEVSEGVDHIPERVCCLAHASLWSMYSALLTTLAGVLDVLADYVQTLARPQEVRW